MKKKRPDDTIRKRICFLFLAVLVLFVGMAIFHHEKRKYALHDRVIEMEHFRSMQAGGSLQEETAELQKQSGLSKGKLLALAFAGAQASFPKKMPTIDELQQTAKWMYRYRPKQYEMLENAFCAVWDDLVCFPVKCRVSYEDSWMEERTYGGKRGHEGTDQIREGFIRYFLPQPGRLSIWDGFKRADGGSESAVNRAVTFIMPISRNMHRGWKKGKQ